MRWYFKAICRSERQTNKPPEQHGSMLLAAFTTPPKLKNNMKREVEYKSAKDDRTIKSMENHTFVAYIKKFILQYERVFLKEDQYLYLTEL